MCCQRNRDGSFSLEKHNCPSTMPVTVNLKTVTTGRQKSMTGCVCACRCASVCVQRVCKRVCVYVCTWVGAYERPCARSYVSCVHMYLHNGTCNEATQSPYMSVTAKVQLVTRRHICGDASSSHSLTDAHQKKTRAPRYGEHPQPGVPLPPASPTPPPTAPRA